MGLSTLISGYITSYFSTVLHIPMFAILLSPAIVPVGFYVAAPPFDFLASPLPNSNMTSETSQPLASLIASERPLAPEYLSFSTTPVCPLDPDLHSAHPPAPGIIPTCNSALTAPPPYNMDRPFAPYPVLLSIIRSASTLALFPGPACNSTAPNHVNNPYSALQASSAAVLPTVNLVAHCAIVSGAFIPVAPDLYSYLRSCQSPPVSPLLLPLSTRPQPFSTSSPVRDSPHLLDIIGCCRPSRR